MTSSYRIFYDKVEEWEKDVNTYLDKIGDRVVDVDTRVEVDSVHSPHMAAVITSAIMVATVKWK